jgi:acetyl-CoA carboxylase biotin carboxylase subunit
MPGAPPFGSVLVANRGEIALRVMRTCRRLGIRTVAVCSDADWASPHVAAADAVVRIGTGPASDSYLRGDAVIEAALASGAEAIHPGYGFLSENASFAEAVEAAGLGWIGPPAAAMRALGDKAAAKALAEASGVPVLPGYHGEAASDEVLIARTGDIGYPLLVKASAGGGGRGMRIVRAEPELREALAAARREAAAAFGDDRLLLERYVERPRHVEVQILGDAHGTLVHLGERECSVQRRHQKLIEESPSPAVTPELRAAMGEAALRLARAAGYRNAGTVEFLLDVSDAFYFLEVNARLQVEHPVTEAVTGLDLVEQQLRVAAGEPLGFDQSAVRLKGHAMELRVVAEDAAAGFLPSTGVVTALDLPAGVRVDAGIAAGGVVSPHYDSLLAKLVAHGPDRAACIDRLVRALDETRVEGVATDVDLLAMVLDEPAFRAGALHTSFLAEHRIVERLVEVPEEVVAAAAGVRSLVLPDMSAGPDAGRPATRVGDPWRLPVPWRVGRVGEPSRWRAGGRTLEAHTRPGGEPPGVRVAVADRTAGDRTVADPAAVDRTAADRTYVVRLVGGSGATGWTAEVDGVPATVWPAGPERAADVVTWDGRRHRLAPAPPPAIGGLAAEADEPDALVAPMPGRVAKLLVAVGDHVVANAPLVVLEAMKMEHVIAAAAPGRVSQLHVGVGDQVGRGAALVDLEGIEPADDVAPAAEADGVEGG